MGDSELVVRKKAREDIIKFLEENLEDGTEHHGSDQQSA